MNGRSTQTELHFSKASLTLEFYTRNVILSTSGFKQKSHTLIRAFQEHQKCVHDRVTRPFRPGGHESVKGLVRETNPNSREVLALPLALALALALALSINQSSTSCRSCSIILPVPVAGSLGIFFRSQLPAL